MAEQYKLYYFPFRGRAEAIRMTFHAAGVPFEDIVISREDWPAKKPTIPGGRMPVLMVTKGGQTKHYVESMAIARMYAKRFGLMPETENDYYLTERMIGETADLDKEFYTVFFAPEDKKAELTQKLMEVGVPKMLDIITASLKESSGPFVAGDKVTLGDLCLVVSLINVKRANPDFLKTKYPMLLEWEKKVMDAKPSLAKYVATLPDYAF